MPNESADRRAPRRPAEDVEGDQNLANSRVTGGSDSEEGDAATTTGTGVTEEYVGRVAGQDEGYAGETGAEARAAAASGDEDAGADPADTADTAGGGSRGGS